ncbi:MAG TPA: bacillithiol biosynthesis cysteine-adding enzyme BshC [Bacteroidia bacterium]|jgi:bacillithiol biosynthesis cysteine-adding enzyme BshC
MQVVKKNIPFQQTGQFPKLFLDYVNSKKELVPFYSHFPDAEGFSKAIADLNQHSFDRTLLVEVITAQYSRTKNCTPDPGLLKKLERPGTFTVTTGHQLCLFTGPLYFIYKIISTINLARGLKKEFPANDFIPVYWMASEDHDVAEIDHIHLFGKTLKWDSNQAGAVGRFESASVARMIEELKGIMGENPNAGELLSVFTRAYVENKNLADATRSLVHQLLGSDLIVIDGDDVRFKKGFASVMQDDIFISKNEKAVNETVKELGNLGYEAQVNPRTINVFYLEKNARVRIESADEKYKKELEAHPENFSPNVVLRPLYQQMLLPNLAYIGGPGELGYWLEYKRMFDDHKLFFPVLVPRNSVMWLDERSAELMGKAGFTEEDIFRDTEELIKEATKKGVDWTDDIAGVANSLNEVYAKLSGLAQRADATLKGAVDAELQKALNGLKNIESKMLRAEKQKKETSLNQLRKTKEKLFPGNVLQERYDNFIPFYLRHGKEFINVLKEHLHPLELQFTLLKEE